MATQIFVNLPVKDLQRSMAFYTALGFSINPQFTNEKAACVVISETIYVMILTEHFFDTFLRNKTISDATKTSEVLLALSAPTREGGDDLAEKAFSAGGSTFRDPDDHGFMYSRSFGDPDGHVWEVVWMDLNAAPQQPE
jgi:predicted lactoylglutathione lyase